MLVTGLGTSKGVLVLGVAIIQMPSIARIVRSATLAQSVRGYVEAAVARGEGTFAILRRELLPNIVSPIAADIGIRFTLRDHPRRLGELPRPRACSRPSADWALMISENRSGPDAQPVRRARRRR